MKSFLLLISLFFFIQPAQSQTSYTWNGSTSTSWNTPANWTPNGVPGSADNVTIVTGSNNCILSSATSINNITLTSGTLNLGGATLTVNGTTATFTAGTATNGTLTVTGATTATFGSGTVSMNCAVNVTSGTLTFRNTTFQGTTSLTKTGSSSDGSYGNNFFNGTLVLTNNGTGNMSLGNSNPDQFNGNSTFNNTGGANLYVAVNSTGNVFNGPATFNNTPTGNYYLSVSSGAIGTKFNSSIVVNSNNGAGVQFCGGNSSATASLAAGQTISVGTIGFSAGTLLLKQFTQLGTTDQNLTLTGTASLNFGPTSTFNGGITASSPGLLLNGAIFNDSTNLTKTGASGDYGSGGNTYNAVCSITNSGSSFLVMGNTNPDIWNSSVTFTDNGSERVLPGWNSVGNQFNGNIYVNTSGSAVGVQFCGGSYTATATQAAGYTVQAGSGGLTAGYLYLKQFTQAGNVPINITATGTSSVLLGPYSSFGGPVTVTSPDIWAQGATYSSAATFNKTGGGNNHNNQYQNIFNSTCTINQQSSTGYFMLGFNSNDQFNNNIILTSTGTGFIYLGWTSGTGTPTLAAGYTIQVGSAGYSAGALSLNTFTQAGSAPINLTFTGTNTGLYFARGSVIGGNVTTSTPDLYFSGCTFNGTVNATKTSANNDYGAGGDVFQAAALITNSGSAPLFMGNGSADTWNNTASFVSNGSSYIGVAWNSAGTQFNDSAQFSSSGSSTGIYFCGNAGATATLASGYPIQIGSGGFSSGTLSLKGFTQAGSTSSNLTLTGATTLFSTGPSSLFGGNLTVVSPRVLMNQTTFSDSVNLTKTGSTGEWSYGGNTFNSTLTVNQQGSAYFGFASGMADTYNGDVYANNNSTDRIIFGNTPTGNQFNGNIILTQIGSSVGIAFGWSASTNETLASGKTISIGAAGFSTGYLQIERFTQNGTTPVNLPLTGTASLTFGPTSSFGGNMTSTSANLLLNGCAFNGTTNLSKTGTTGDFGAGGNVFNGSCSITNSGSSYLVLGNVNPDTWNSDVTFTDNGSERILPGWASAGNQFNGNIYVNSSGSATGIQFCGGNTTATATLASGYSIQTGSAGFNAGYLILKQFTQLGSAAINLNLGSTANYLQFGPLSVIGGNVTSSSPGLDFNGCTFNGSVNSTKTGASSDGSTGNDIFNGVTTITDAGSGNLSLGNGNLDQFNTTATFNNTGSGNLGVANNSPNNVFGGVTTFNNSPTVSNVGIYVSWYSNGTVFNNNIVVNSTGGFGVEFCGGNTSATATLASGYTIATGAAGFTAGTLLLRQFTQSGSTPQNITLTGAGNLTYGPLSTFNGNVTSSSSTLAFNGGTFNGTATCTKTGSSSDWSYGTNVFNGVTVITDNGTGFLLMGQTNPDQFNNTTTFNNNSGNNFYVAYNSPNNVFNGVTTFNNSPSTNNVFYVSSYSTGTVFNNNILVNSTYGQGIQFCTGNTTASATLASGYTVSVGTTGFTSGTLLLRQFTQSGSTPQNLTLTGSGNLTFGPTSAFGGNLTSSSPALFFNGCIFSGTVNSIKTGTSGDASYGNNTFNGTSTFTNSSTGTLQMSTTGADAYNANTYFVQSSTGPVYPNYYGYCTYGGNVTVTSPSTTSMIFGKNGGTANFNGSALQTINVTSGTPVPVFSNLAINNTGSGVTLYNTPVNVSASLVLTSGLLNTTSTYILTMLNGSVTSSGTALSTSYVNGPMRYQKSSSGSSVLNFPIGNSPDCRPFVLTVNHSTATLYNYTAQLYNASAQALGYTMPPSVDAVSSVHYYTIARTDVNNNSQPIAGLSGNQTIQIYFGADDYVTNGPGLTIVKNTYLAPTAWINIGGSGAPAISGSTPIIGSVQSTSSPTAFNSFSTFALADQTGSGNILPLGILSFNAAPDQSQVALNWSVTSEFNTGYFTVERSKDGINFNCLPPVSAEALADNNSGEADYATYDPNPYTGLSYYRLKQTHTDSSTAYSDVVSVDFQEGQSLSVYPNPVTTGTVYISGLEKTQASLMLGWFDERGRSLSQQTVSVADGTATVNAPFTSGVYFLKFMTADGVSHVRKVVIMK